MAQLGTTTMEPVRLRRPAVACIECRRRKVKCDRGHPCLRCSQSNLLCSYTARSVSSVSRLPAMGTNTGLERAETGTTTPTISPTLNLACSPHTYEDASNDNDTGNAHARASVALPPVIHARDAAPKSITLGQGSVASRSDSSLSPHERLISMNDGQDRPQYWKAVLCQLAKASLASKVCNAVSGAGSTTEVEELQKQCARLAQSEERLRRELYQSYTWDSWRDCPSRLVCDELVKLYLSSFEGVFRVLHIPTFQHQYQQHRAAAQSSANRDFQYTLSVVTAIGACIQTSAGDSKSSLRPYAIKSILDAQKWVMSNCEGPNITLATLQTYCLILLAQQTTGLGLSTISISIDALVRAAMRLDLHRPQRPDCGSSLSETDVQLRKKLWCTIVELSIQSSLDAGLPPSLLPADLQIDLPSNIDDVEISHSAPKPLNSSNKTDATVQILLARTATVRLRILHHLYGFSSIESYDTILQLGGELMDQYRANVRMLEDLSSQPCAGHSDMSTRFQMSLLDALTLGPLMALHSPFAYLARANPKFYFSRKICFEAAWALPSRRLPPSTQRSAGPTRTLYDALLVHASGLFERVHLQSTALICMEMLSSFTEGSFLSNSLFDSAVVLEAVQQSIDLCARRLDNGTTDVASHVILSCALAHIRALKSRSEPQGLVAEGAVQSLKECLHTLQCAAARRRTATQSSMAVEATEPGISHDSNALNEDWWASQDPLDLTITSASWWGGEDGSLLNDSAYQST